MKVITFKGFTASITFLKNRFLSENDYLTTALCIAFYYIKKCSLVGGGERWQKRLRESENNRKVHR